jgi:arginyl-tRNA synthetase
LKQEIEQLLMQAVRGLQAGGLLPEDIDPKIVVERTRQKEHGDFASNLALMLAKAAGKPPRELAEELVRALPASSIVSKTEIAGPGFINFFLESGAQLNVIDQVLDQGENYGRSTVGAERNVQVEFVSANPTGPLHVGHGRGAAYGATVSNLLAAVGFRVHREYYVNDAGRQMDILATSIWLRYLDLAGEEVVFPVNGYKGDYIWDIAATLHRENGDAYRHPIDTVMQGVPEDAQPNDDKDLASQKKEAHIDALIGRAKSLLGTDGHRRVLDLGLDVILGDIRQDLEEFRVTYDDWFSERTLTESGAVKLCLDRLQQSGHVYEKNGALWFRSTDFGDEKDRVVVRDNGQATYFASDIAYHMDKLERGFERVIDIWGADHHGYVPRVKAALAAIGDDPSKLDVLLVQFAVLYRGGEKVQMSTRSGEFVTLRELRKEVGNDAARFFYVMRKCEQHMDFDLDLAKSQSNDNPVYYVQYAHARVCSVFRQLKEKGLAYDKDAADHALLNEDHEQALITALSRYPELIENAALAHEPHQVAQYLRELANGLHTYYNAHTFLVDDDAIRNARLNLVAAVRQVIANALGLLGVSAPESM